jgi:hypothetical protein
VIIAWRQRLGPSAAGIDVVEVFTFGAAEAIATAYVALTGDGLAGGSLAGGVDVVA